MRLDRLLTLLLVFAPLSLTTIGGGQSAISEYHRQMVGQLGWMTEQLFVYDFAMSRLAPGPGSLLVTLIGWQVAGWAGALVASVAIFLPSSLLLYALAQIWAHYHGRPFLRAIERGLAPVAAGLILAGSLTLVEAARGGWIAWVVTFASTALLMFTRVSPFVLIGAGAAIFLATT